MTTVLVTGFEPFDGRAANPSERVARALDGRVIAGRRVVGAVLPVTFDGAPRALLAAVRAAQPELVVCTGEAGERAAISVERVAINLDDARIPDNAGARPIHRAIAPEGPAAYFSTLPVEAIVAALAAAGHAVELSSSAGAFVCNHVFYALMHAQPSVAPRAGFIHLPTAPDSTAAIALAIEAALR